MKNDCRKILILKLMQDNKCTLEMLADGLKMQYVNVADMLLGRSKISDSFFTKALFFLSKSTHIV